MSRPLRIEYPGAWYHVMNRGAGNRNVFDDDNHRHCFMGLLGDLQRMFHVQTHAYCLLDNHYHLLLHTPDGNLQRAMRHLNGVYTQRYNRLRSTDGPLFRGRYKALLIDVDEYLLNVSRYVHLNPVEAGVVEQAENYPWTSYAAYIGEAPAPAWLVTGKTLGLIGVRRVRERYRAFVEAGADEETIQFFARKKLQPVLGGEAFRARVLTGIAQNEEIPETRWPERIPSMSVIVGAVAKASRVDEGNVLRTPRGRGRLNLARQIAMYISRRHYGIPLAEIARCFNLTHYGSVSAVVSRFGKALESDPDYVQLVKRIVKDINSQT